MRSAARGLTVLAAAAVLAGCATTPGGQRLAEQDPLEGFNRGVWGFNRTVDKVALKPAAVVYKTATPTAARRGVRNVLNNADEPLSFINALLQGKVGRAFHTLGRFVVNTTIGVGGLADHASSMGLKEKPEDFGQTLAVWGVNAGPYVMLPFFGPSTLRDSVGLGTEFFADPVRIAVKEYSGLSRTERLGITGLEAIDLRAELIELGADNFLKSSLDPYATARAAYLQRRQSLILDQDEGAETNGESVDPADFDMGTAADPAPSAPSPTDEQPATAPVPGAPIAPSAPNTAEIDGSQ